MPRRRFRHREQRPPRSPHAMAEVEILAVEEIRLVESTDLVEGAAPNQDRRRGQACDSLGHVGHPIDVIGEHSDAATHCADRCETQEPAGPHGATEEMDGSELATRLRSGKPVRRLMITPCAAPTRGSSRRARIPACVPVSSGSASGFRSKTYGAVVAATPRFWPAPNPGFVGSASTRAPASRATAPASS